MENELKYGLTATCRLPAKIKIRLMDEAQKRGVSFSTYMGAVIIDAIEKRDNSIENQKEVTEDNEKDTLSQSAWYKGERKKIIDVLLKNEQILDELYRDNHSQEIAKQKFIDKGFNFEYGTHTRLLNSRPIISVFSINYSKLGNSKIKIIKL